MRTSELNVFAFSIIYMPFCYPMNLCAMLAIRKLPGIPLEAGFWDDCDNTSEVVLSVSVLLSTQMPGYY